MSPFTMMASGNLVVFRSSRSLTGELVLLRFPSESRGIPEQLWYLDLSILRRRLSRSSHLLIPFLTSGYLPFLDGHRVISPHHDYIRGDTFFQVTTLPDVPGGTLSHVYHSMLELPNFTTPYFMDMQQTNTLPASWSSSDHAGWFHADPGERILAIELGSPSTSGPAGTFTRHTLHVPHNVFLSYIAAHHHRSSTSLQSETETETKAETETTDGVAGRPAAVTADQGVSVDGGGDDVDDPEPDPVEEGGPTPSSNAWLGEDVVVLL
ncbi:hypothetical protein BJV74DRAFT_882774 [Russula compacta]|nr:hypothetical protein BJV74DRAFT_882774 [Russula compacta]